MNEPEYRQLIDELQEVILGTLNLLNAFEESGMNDQMADDYQRLHEILKTAITDQRRYQADFITLLRRASHKSPSI